MHLNSQSARAGLMDVHAQASRAQLSCIRPDLGPPTADRSRWDKVGSSFRNRCLPRSPWMENTDRSLHAFGNWTSVDTLRLKLLKIGARLCISVRRVVLQLSAAYHWKPRFQHAWQALRCRNMPLSENSAHPGLPWPSHAQKRTT